MASSAVIFDVDGTLVDTNELHALAWQRAFEQEVGQRPELSRILLNIGMGGDRLVPAVVGEALEQSHGDALRDAESRHFERLLELAPKRVFPEVERLLEELRRRGLPVALATSSQKANFERLLGAFGLDLPRRVSTVITADDVASSKPAPDLICKAVSALGVEPARCLMVGDTPYDGEAARAAGVAFVGVRSGGWSDEALRAAGARLTVADTGELVRSLDRVLALEAPDLGTQRSP